MQAADAEVVRLQQSVEGLKQESQKGLFEMRKATQQWAVAQADLRSTRHQLKVLQSQVCFFFFFFSFFFFFFSCFFFMLALMLSMLHIWVFPRTMTIFQTSPFSDSTIF